MLIDCRKTTYSVQIIGVNIADKREEETYSNKSRVSSLGIKDSGHFKYPFEQIEITLAYLKFLSWAQSGGLENTEWYINDVPANIDSYPIYSEQ